MANTNEELAQSLADLRTGFHQQLSPAIADLKGGLTHLADARQPGDLYTRPIELTIDALERALSATTRTLDMLIVINQRHIAG